MAKGNARILKVVGKFQKLVDEVNKGVNEVQSAISVNVGKVAEREAALIKLKDTVSKENAILDVALKQGQEIAGNINKIIGK